MCKNLVNFMRTIIIQCTAGCVQGNLVIIIFFGDKIYLALKIDDFLLNFKNFAIIKKKILFVYLASSIFRVTNNINDCERENKKNSRKWGHTEVAPSSYCELKEHTSSIFAQILQMRNCVVRSLLAAHSNIIYNYFCEKKVRLARLICKNEI